MRSTTSKTLDRLAALEKRGTTDRNRPVAMFPRLVTVDEWEAISSPQQRELKANMREDGPPDYSGIGEFELVPNGWRLFLSSSEY